jgi:PAS domain S-box-containing protein
MPDVRPAPHASVLDSPSEHARAVALRLQMALAMAGLGTWDWDPNTDHVTWNDVLERICGFLPGTFSGTTAEFEALIVPDDVARVQEAAQRAREDHVEYHCEFRIRRKNDGALRTVVSRGAYMFDALGRAMWASGILADVTDRREVEAAARSADQRRRLFFERNPVPMFILDPESRRYIDVNAAAIEQYGYSRDEFLAMRCDELRPPEEVSRLQQAFRDRRDGQPARGRWRHRTRDGCEFDVDVISHDEMLEGQRVLVLSAIAVDARAPLQA